MPKCALCKRQNADLRQSHIVPKLIYKRIRSHPQSRFRNLSDIKKPLQDGEKHKMLCHDCEIKFSAFETRFANDFMDIYLKDESIPKITPNFGWLSNYCLSVTWRILFDDLYRMNSYEQSWHRSTFEQFESILRQHLNVETISDVKPSEVENYIFKLGDIVKTQEHSTLLEKMIFGYSYFDDVNYIFAVYTYYAGLIFATRFFPKDFIILDSGKNLFISLFRTKKRTMWHSLRHEIIEETVKIAIQYKEVMTPELQKNIKEYYNGK